MSSHQPLSSRRTSTSSTLDAPSERHPRPHITSYIDRLAEARYGGSTSFADLEHAGRQLQVASSNLRALLDEPVPNIATPSLSTQDYTSDGDSGRRAKRRKLDSDRVESGFTGFSYGHYGQVEPGKLKMEIVSCDGGIYSEDHGASHAAENVLRNDHTVYCTKGDRCNLVLRHQGGTPFCLKELIIKAPPRGYTAP